MAAEDLASPSRMDIGAARYRGALTVATIAGWAAVFAWLTGQTVVLGSTRFWEEAGRRACLSFAGLVLCFGLYLVLVRTERMRMRYRLAAAIGLCLLASFAFAFVAVTTGTTRWLGHAPSALIAVGRVILVTGATGFWLFLAWTALYFSMSIYEHARVNALNAAESRALAADAQARMLRYQVNPHFLFNTLNTLSDMVLHREVAAAERIIHSLSDFLRYSLEEDPDHMVTLTEETEVQARYLEIERLRFGDRLSFSFDIPQVAGNVRVPSMLLQPLVENAVKHGLSATSTPVTIEIGARQSGSEILVWVQDDAPAPTRPAASGLGVGLANVERRLAVTYGPAGRLAAGPRPSGGYRAELRIPLEVP